MLNTTVLLSQYIEIYARITTSFDCELRDFLVNSEDISTQHLAYLLSG